MFDIMLEIIGFDLEGCLSAQENGADRIELCAKPEWGGVTPSKNLIKLVKKELDIPVFLMVRPRGGDFIYSSNEVETMKTIIKIGLEVNIDGFVFGALNSFGEVDEEICHDLITSTLGKPCTFHRAFDETLNPIAAIDELIKLGFKRILTSGQKPTAIEGIPLLKASLEKASNDIIIMPGSGVTSNNLAKIDSLLNAKEYHSSAKKVDQFSNYLGVNGNEVKRMSDYLTKRLFD